MWTRKQVVNQGLTNILITATFDWDRGDPSAGIGEGFGEDTCAEIEAGPFVTWITWRDHSFTTYQAQGRLRRRVEIPVVSEDPATWVIDSIETVYRFSDRGGQRYLTLADRTLPEQDSGHYVKLSELPEVLAVVREAFKDFKASERLTAAQENTQMLEAEIDSVKWHMSASDEPTEHDTSSLAELQQAMVETRAKLDAATAHARERGVTE